MNTNTHTPEQEVVSAAISVLRNGGTAKALSDAIQAALSVLEPDAMVAMRDHVVEAMRDPRVAIPRLRGLSYQLGVESAP